MDYTYAWYDGAQLATSSFDSDTGSGSNTIFVSTYAYDGLGRVASVDIADGRRRTASFAYTPEGQVVGRKERAAASANPEDMRYFVSGMQIGELTSNGNNDPLLADYAQTVNTIRNWTPNPAGAPFRWNTTGGATRGTFGAGSGYDPINPYGAGANATQSSYTVRGGETLQAIAANAWGDATMWYLLASANGMSGGEALAAGQSLIIPDRVTNIHNNSWAFEVYDPNKALGDTSPPHPSRRKRGA